MPWTQGARWSQLVTFICCRFFFKAAASTTSRSVFTKSSRASREVARDHVYRLEFGCAQPAKKVYIGATTKLSDCLTHLVEVKLNRAQPAKQHNTQSANTIDGQSEITLSAKPTHGTLQLTWTNKVRHAV